MSPIDIVSASAGTGKTTRLAGEIAEAIIGGAARPERILATTFTNRAASELIERARTRLLREGRASDAQRLQAARIGTVNSVCGRLVSDFAFDRGLSPSLRVLDERQSREVAARARARVLPARQVAELEELRGRMPGFEWDEAIGRVIDLARANAIPPDDLTRCAERSIEEMRSLLGHPATDGDLLDQDLDEALSDFLREVDTSVDETKVTRDYVELAQAARRRGAADVLWTDWLGLATKAPGRLSREQAEPVQEAASAHDRHPRLHSDVERAIELVFDAARRTLEAYDQHKRRLGVIDFVDQEAYALELLGDPTVCDRLSEELDLALVDEFQDTSPIQLAIFLRLASLTQRSFWVGDPKQAIYGFRGADPALMEAAVAGLLGGRQPESLDRSWRSRPELVHLTSDLFARAFSETGIEQRLVRIHPGIEEDDESLGEIVERWVLQPPEGKRSSNIQDDVESIAAGVKDLLQQGTVIVRDPLTGVTRPARAGDVAVLCPRNDQCQGVADSLAQLGLPAVLARPGLLNTIEGRLALCALQLWNDPRDGLARAELARILEHPTSGERWLERLLEAREKRDTPFDDLEVGRDLAERRQRESLCGLLKAYDTAISAIGLAEICLRLGDSQRRLSNLEALRSIVARYVDLCRSEAVPCTLQGLLAHLSELVDEGVDEQAAAARAGAVVISTWHGAKGLEWPVTILADLGWAPEASAMGVRVVTEHPDVDLENPLAGRWIRYWPDPYAPKRSRAPLHDRLARHPASEQAVGERRREDLRLLYVGWTRARDRIVLATRPGSVDKGRFAVLQQAGNPLLHEPDEIGRATWGARRVVMRTRKLRAEAPRALPPVPGDGYVSAGPTTYPPATRAPSESEGRGEAGSPATISERIPLSMRESDAMDALGNAVHGFLGSDRPDLPMTERINRAQGYLERFGVFSALDPAALPRAADALARWASDQWGGAVWHREWPLHHRQADGSIVRGYADLVLELPDRLVLVDHKTFPGSPEQAVERARGFAAQLSAYAAALLAATAKRVDAAFIHLPISGLVTPVRI